jgi:hypothetical protein
MSGDKVRKTPCASCPFRRDVPSGIWSAGEYDKLPVYDGEISEQAMCGAVQLFSCHQGSGELCAGWAGHRDHPADLLAIRIGIAHKTVDPAVLGYTTDVPLFASGAEAAEHGKRDILVPGERARDQVSKIIKVRTGRGKEVRLS